MLFPEGECTSTHKYGQAIVEKHTTLYTHSDSYSRRGRSTKPYGQIVSFGGPLRPGLKSGGYREELWSGGDVDMEIMKPGKSGWFMKCKWSPTMAGHMFDTNKMF
jgi:hypothetical protein